MEFTDFHCGDNVFIQNQIAPVGFRNNHTLFACQSARMTKTEKPLDFLIHAADRLYFAILIHRAGYCKALINRCFDKGGYKTNQLCQRCAVTIDVAIRLFHGNMGRNSERKLLRVTIAQITADDHDAFRVNGLTQTHFSFDIHNTFTAGISGHSNACR